MTKSCNRTSNIRLQRLSIVQGAVLIVYKVFLDYTFGFYQALFDSKTYHLDFSLLKYLIGWVLLVVIYYLINARDEEDSAKFLLNLMLTIGIIPITVIYAFENESTVCFSCICSMFALVAYAVGYRDLKGTEIREIKEFRFYPLLYKISVVGSALVVVLLFAFFIKNDGVPSLTAMDFSKIYTVVRANYFIDNKYIGYIYTIAVLVLVPYLEGVCLERRYYFSALLLLAFLFLMFLYSGNKTTLFSILVIVGVFTVRTILKRDAAIIITLCIGLTAICASWIVTGSNRFYDILVRRVLLLPASLKFAHYDYFCNNEKLGFRGMILGKLLGVNQYTPEGIIHKETFTYAIGRMLDKDGTNCNTGVLIEGFDKFGYVGFLVIGLLLIVLLLAIRKFEKNTSHNLVLITCSYFVYSLNDGFLTGTAELSFIVLLLMALSIRISIKPSMRSHKWK